MCYVVKPEILIVGLLYVRKYFNKNICRRHQREQSSSYRGQQSPETRQWSQALCLLWDLRHLRPQRGESLSRRWVRPVTRDSQKSSNICSLSEDLCGSRRLQQTDHSQSLRRPDVPWLRGQPHQHQRLHQHGDDVGAAGASSLPGLRVPPGALACPPPASPEHIRQGESPSTGKQTVSQNWEVSGF